MAVQATEEDPEAGKKAGSPALLKALDRLQELPEDQLSKLLDILESAIPEEFRHL